MTREHLASEEQKGSTRSVSLQRAEMRKFAWTMTSAFAILGAFALYRNKSLGYTILFSASGIFLLAGLAFPIAIRPVHKAWMGLAHVLGWINTKIILALLFYLVLTPFGVVMRIAGRDPLSRRLDRSRPTYWHPRGAMKSAADSYEHLF